MSLRSFPACALLLCLASVCEAQRFGITIRPVFRPPTPVYRPPTPVIPVIRPNFGPTYTPHTGTGYADGAVAAANAPTDEVRPQWGPTNPTPATETRPTTDEYAKPNRTPVAPAGPAVGWGVWALLAAVVVVFITAVAWVASRRERERPAPVGFTPPPAAPPVPPPTVLVRITGVPEGEAPEWVRQAWVGLVLPAVDNRPVPGQEVLSGRQTVAPAYQVKSVIALTLLEIGERTAAADWWREHTTQANDPSQHFLFSPDCCSPLDGRADASGGVH